MTNVIGQYFYIADEGDRTWAVKFRSDIPFDKLTRLYIAFAWIRDGLLTYNNMSNTPTDQQRIAALVGACRQENPTAQIYISSGYDSDGSMYKEAANNPSAFADSVVAFLRANKLDGYDMDWENGLQKQALNDLLIAVRSALNTASKQDGKTYGLTLAVWQYGYLGKYDLATIASNVDEINIMSYGTGLLLPNCVRSYSDFGFPMSKMIGGIDTESDYHNWGGTVDTLGSNGTIAEKAAYAWQNGLAGMMAWRLDNDYVVKDPPTGQYSGPSTYRGAIQLFNSMPIPVFLFTAQNPARYFYTTNPLGSPDSDWTAQGIAFYAFGADCQASTGQAVVPVYQYSAGDPQRYNLNTGISVGPGWTNDKKTAFYAFQGQAPNTVPLYQYHKLLPGEFWNLAYSVNENDPKLAGWTIDGPTFFVYGA